MKPKPPSFETLIQNQGICLATEGRSQKTIDWYAINADDAQDACS